MSLTVIVPDEIAEAVSRQSQQSGIAPEQLILDTLLVQFPPLSTAPVPQSGQHERDEVSHPDPLELIPENNVSWRMAIWTETTERTKAMNLSPDKRDYAAKLASALAEIEDRSRFMNPRPDERDWLREGRAGGMYGDSAAE